MAFLSRIKTWVTLEILEADDLNAEFNNIIDNAIAKNSFNAATFLYAVDNNTPIAKTRAEVMGLLSGQADADFAMNTHKITGVTDPTAAQDVATKAYGDANWGDFSENDATLYINKDYSSGDEDATINFNNSTQTFKWEYASSLAVHQFTSSDRIRICGGTFNAAADFDNTSQAWVLRIGGKYDYDNGVAGAAGYSILSDLENEIDDTTPEICGFQSNIYALTAQSKAAMYGFETQLIKYTNATQDNTTIGVDSVIMSKVDPAGAAHYGAGFRAYSGNIDSAHPNAIRQHTAYLATGDKGWKYGFLYFDTDLSAVLFQVDQNGVGYFANNLSSGGNIEAKPASGNAVIYADAPTGSDSYFILEENNVTKGYFTWDGANISLGNTGTLTFKTVGGTTQATLSSVGDFNAEGNITATGNCCVDYVFEEDYNLMELDELHTFIKKEKHLPNITIGGNNQVHLINSVGQLLEKTEEQALYILQLHKRLRFLEKSLTK